MGRLEINPPILWYGKNQVYSAQYTKHVSRISVIYRNSDAYARKSVQMLQTDTLEKSTLDLLIRLQKIPLLDNLRLVGGTALALHLGHRKSVDLDFSGNINATGLQIADELFENGYKDVVVKYDTKNIKVFFKSNKN
jgi:hypothetical protein